MDRNIVSIVLKWIAAAMGIAVVVMNLLGTLDSNTAFSLLGLGLLAQAIAALQK